MALLLLLNVDNRWYRLIALLLVIVAVFSLQLSVAQSNKKREVWFDFNDNNNYYYCYSQLTIGYLSNIGRKSTKVN